MPLKTDRSVEILFLNVHGAPVQKSLMYCKLLTSHVESRVGVARQSSQALWDELLSNHENIKIHTGREKESKLKKYCTKLISTQHFRQKQFLTFQWSMRHKILFSL